jgi:hypothetical protein
LLVATTTLAQPRIADLSEQAWRNALGDAFQADADAFGALYPADADRARADALPQMKHDKGLASIWL